jgi:hypothetical protein
MTQLKALPSNQVVLGGHDLLPSQWAAQRPFGQAPVNRRIMFQTKQDE